MVEKTRNQVYRQRYRGFESHPLRQKLCQQSAFRLLAFLFQFGAKPKPLSIASGEVRFAFHCNVVGFIDKHFSETVDFSPTPEYNIR